MRSRVEVNMKKSRLPVVLLALLVAGAVAAQQPPAPAFDSEACMKHCKEMAESHQKMVDSQKAAKEKRDAAWKEIETQLDVAKKARGDRKVAALESAIEKLVAFHGEMQRSMGERAPGMMGGMMGHPMGSPGMGHEMGGMMGHGMGMGMCPCCQSGPPAPAPGK
jgi:hypothetical protein